MPPLNLQLTRLASGQNRDITSSYENVYNGVPLDPEKNRLSLDAEELDIGDRFDTKQADIHLQSSALTSSYEQLYDQDQSNVTQDITSDEGESREKSSDETKLKSPCATQASSTTHPGRQPFLPDHHGHLSAVSPTTCPVYITVEKDLDKLVDDSDIPESSSSREFKERSLSCEVNPNLEPHVDDVRMRHNSSPDMTGVGVDVVPQAFSRGTSLSQLSFFFNFHNFSVLSFSFLINLLLF